MKDINILGEMGELGILIDIERENVHCLYTALINSEETPKNYGMMMTGIITRLGGIQDRLNVLSDVVKEKAL